MHPGKIYIRSSSQNTLQFMHGLGSCLYIVSKENVVRLVALWRKICLFKEALWAVGKNIASQVYTATELTYCNSTSGSIDQPDSNSEVTK